MYRRSLVRLRCPFCQSKRWHKDFCGTYDHMIRHSAPSLWLSTHKYLLIVHVYPEFQMSAHTWQSCMHFQLVSQVYMSSWTVLLLLIRVRVFTSQRGSKQIKCDNFVGSVHVLIKCGEACTACSQHVWGFWTQTMSQRSQDCTDLQTAWTMV